jgi:hypothetical protein
MTFRTALNNGKVVCSCVEIEEEEYIDGDTN